MWLHLILWLKKMLVMVRTYMDKGSGWCWNDYVAWQGVMWRKLWHLDYVCRQMLQYKQRLATVYYSHGYDVIIPMVVMLGGLLTICICIYKGKLDDICVVQWPWGEQVLGMASMQKVIAASGLTMNTSKVVLLLCILAAALWLLPPTLRWILVGLWGKIIRTLYINIQLGVQVIWQAPWSHIKITRYWHEQELLQFITTTIDSYKNYTAQPELQVNIDKLLTQLCYTPVHTYDELQIVQFISAYMHMHYPKPIPPSWAWMATEYVFIHHPLLAIACITLSMLTVVCVVHNRPRPDLEIYHWRKPWDWEWEWPWETLDWYDVPDGKNLSDYTYEQLEQYRVPRPSRALLMAGKVVNEGIHRQRWWHYWRWHIFQPHVSHHRFWYPYYERLQLWLERRGNGGRQD